MFDVSNASWKPFLEGSLLFIVRFSGNSSCVNILSSQGASRHSACLLCFFCSSEVCFVVIVSGVAVDLTTCCIFVVDLQSFVRNYC